jgi:hypothetical protein
MLRPRNGRAATEPDSQQTIASATTLPPLTRPTTA